EACLDGVCAPALEDPGGPALTPGSPLRVHAVGLHPTLADVETQAAWRDFVRARFARDVVPALASDRPNLIVLPENTTLTTAFIGARGETGRSATSTMVALGNVLGSHLDAIAFYNE